MPQILAYADRFSARPGDPLTIYVSVSGASSFAATLVRLINGDENPAGPGAKAEIIQSELTGVYDGEEQPIRVGSYIVVNSAASADGDEMTVSIVCRPSVLKRGMQGLISRWSATDNAGWAMILDEEFRPALLIGDGSGQVQRLTLERPATGNWCQIVATLSKKAGAATLCRLPLKGTDTIDLAAGVSCKREPLRLMPKKNESQKLIMAALATGENPAAAPSRVTACLTGRLEKPRILGRAIADEERDQLLRTDTPPAWTADILGWWNFEDAMAGDDIRDLSRHGRHGRAINCPARAVTGYKWDGSVHSWKVKPSHYGAIHFHADDLTDARWKPSVTFRLPANLKSGIYAARLTAGDYVEHVPFAVRPAASGKRSALVFLMPTASYLAYSNISGPAFNPPAEMAAGHTIILGPHDRIVANHPGIGLSLYDRHLDGTGSMYASRYRPILTTRPDYMAPVATPGSPLWQFAADLHITDWLEARGIDYDVLTDEDLHREGIDALSGYRAVITGTHPEYHSTEQLDAVQRFVDGGGRLFYTGGNGFYWRIAYHPQDSGIIELRRAEGGWRTWGSDPGEYYDSFTGNYGGLWRNNGRPTGQLTGLIFSVVGMNVCGHYRRLPDSLNARVAFIFEGVGAEEKIGNFGLKGGGAAGIELDRFEPLSNAPKHTLVLAESANLPYTYTATPETFVGAARNPTAEMTPQVKGNIAFFETAGGGAVFSTGSIAWAGSLSTNNYANNVSRITENVIRRFIDPAPFKLPTA